jgi:hypothetical protein
MAASVKVTVSSDVALVEIEQRFRGAYCLHHIIRAIRTFETSINFY